MTPTNPPRGYIGQTLSLILLLVVLITPAGFSSLAGSRAAFGSTTITARADALAAGVQSVIAISGKSSVGTEALVNVTLTLASPNNPRFTTRTVRSSLSGAYIFTNVPAGFTYTLTPSKTFYDFTPVGRTYTNVSLNQENQNFVGVLRTYSIRGRAKVITGTNQEAGLSGATMTLTRTRPAGFTPRTVTTSSDGSYAFPGVPVAGDYTLTAWKKNYTFDLASLSYRSLSSDQTNQDFVARLNHYIIGGNVLVRDVTIKLSGSATATTFSDSGGYYSFPNLAPAGNYTVTVSKPGYTFDSRSKRFTDLSSDQIADFAITASPPHVLEYDGLKKRVNYGTFWRPGVDLGHFFWEFWAMPGHNASNRFLLSDGYTGAHALLFGFSGMDSGYALVGNVYNGSIGITFASDEGPAAYEWGHVAVGWDGQTIVTYFDGVPVGMRAYTGPRRTIGPTGGGGTLYIGGSDHQNLLGRIAQLRGYEGSDPLEDEIDHQPSFSAFTPQTIFDCNDPFWQNCTLLSSFIHPTRPVADLSGNNHLGKLGGTPPPEYVIDPMAPTALGGNPLVPPIDTSPPPPPVPRGALVFDSFSRRNSTYAFDGAGGMGSTEGGSAGPEDWQYDSQAGQKLPFGILNGRAVILSNEAHAAWVSTGSSTGNLEVSVNRWARPFRTGLSTGLVFRLQDANNFFYAYTTGETADTQKLYVGMIVNGSKTTLANEVAMPAIWLTLRIDTLSTGSINVYAGTTLVYSTNSDTLAHATNAGIWSWGKNQALANRWDNFTVREIP